MPSGAALSAHGGDIPELASRCWFSSHQAPPYARSAHSHPFLRGKYFVAQNYAELFCDRFFFGGESFSEERGRVIGNAGRMMRIRRAHRREWPEGASGGRRQNHRCTAGGPSESIPDVCISKMHPRLVKFALFRAASASSRVVHSCDALHTSENA